MSRQARLVVLLVAAGTGLGAAPPLLPRVQTLGRPIPRLPLKISRPALALSPDGRSLSATGEQNDGLPAEAFRVTILDLSAPARRRELLGHTDRVQGVSFSPDGKRLASASKDGTARLWLVASGREVARFTGKDDFWGCRFSPRGKYLAAWHWSVVRLLDGASLREAGSIDAGQRIYGAEVSDDETILAALVALKGPPEWRKALKFWSLPGGKPAPSPLSARKDVWSFALLPGGKQAVVGHSDGVLRVWDWRRGVVVRKLGADDFLEEHIALSGDGKVLVGAGGEIRFWDAATGREHTRSTGRCGFVEALVVSHKGDFAVTGDSSDGLRVWPAAPPGAKGPVGPRGWLGSLAYSPDGQLLVAGGDEGVVHVWGLPEGRLLRALEHAKEADGIWGLQFREDGLLIGTIRGGAVATWDASTGTPRWDQPPDGREFAEWGSARRGVWAWTAKDRVYLGALGGRKKAHALGPAAVDEDGLPLRLLHGVPSPDGRSARLLWQYGLWEERGLLKGRPVQRFQLPGRPLRVCMAGDGERLVSCHEGLVRFWERLAGWREGRPPLKLPIEETPQCAFSADDRFVGIAAEGRAWLVEFATGAVVARCRTGLREATVIAVSRHGDELAVVGEDWAPRRIVLADARLAKGPLRGLWKRLASPDAGLAYQAGWALARRGDVAVRLLRRRIRLPTATDKQIAEWVRGLDSEDFDTRQEAEKVLGRLRWRAAPALERCVANPQLLEQALRARRLLEAVATSEEMRLLRGVAVLERAAGREALQLLKQLAAGPESRLRAEAREALARLRRAGRGLSRRGW